MREIKFRAFDRKLNKMFPVHRMEWSKIDNGITFLHGVDIHDKDSDFSGDVTYGGPADKKTGTPPVERYVLMQYSGLKDKKGTEIYEGDILVWDKFKEVRSVVNFREGMFLSGDMPLADCLDEEIVGNIYEQKKDRD